jgi:hypothetical protein
LLIAGSIQGVESNLYLSELAGFDKGVADQRRRAPSGAPHVVNPEELITCIPEVKRVRDELAFEHFTPVIGQLLKLYSGTGRGCAREQHEKRKCKNESNLEAKQSVPSHKNTS